MEMVDKRVIVLGGGGHSKVVIETMRACGWNPVGVLDRDPMLRSVLDVPVLGDDSLAEDLHRKGHVCAFVAIGENGMRRSLALSMREIGFRLITAIHPSAVVSPSASIGSGVVVMPHATINACARIGDFAIVNTGAIVEHDCVVGEAAHLAPRTVLGGNVHVGEEVLFGIGAAARPQSVIGARSVVGAGAVVIGRIADGDEVVGSPARARASARRKAMR
jgi:UDP-perosamine 4-acetyltransferase